MAEFRLDIIANTEGLNQGLKNLQDGLSNISEEAIKAGKDTQAAFSQSGGVDKFQRSLKEQVMTLVKFETEIKRLRTEIKNTFDTKQVGELKKQLDSSTQSLINFTENIDNSAQASKRLKTQLWESKNALAEMERQGLDTTDTYKELELTTAKLQKQLKDTDDRVKFFASDTRGLDALIGVAKAATAAFSVGQGAMALFGAENDNVQKALLKVNAAMAILNGLQEIQAALQKSSAARIAIETVLRKAKIFVLGSETVATQGLTTAQIVAANAAKVLRAALIATGVGALVVLLGSLYSAISAMNDFKDETDNTTDAIKKQDEALKDLTDTIDFNTKKQLADAKLLGANNQTLREIERQGLKEQLDVLARNIEDKRKLLEEADKQRIEAFKNGSNDEKKAALETYNESKQALAAALTERTKALRDYALFNKETQIENNKEVLDANKDFEEKQAKLRQQAAENKKKQDEKDEQERKRKADALKQAEEILNANMLNQFDIEAEQNKKIIDNNIKFLNDLEEIRQLELDLEFESGNKSITEAERIAEEKLNVEIEFAQKKLDLLKSLGGDEQQIKAIELAIQKAKNQLKELGENSDKTNFLKAIGLGDLNEEDIESVKESIEILKNSIQEILGGLLDVALENNDKVLEGLEEQISRTRDNISRQTDLQNEGRTNNLKAEEENLKQLEFQKMAALEREKKLQKQKLALDSAQQLSSLITASANIFAALSPAGPAGVAIAIATIAAMFSAFALSKVRAVQLINKQTLGKGGVVKGKSHDADGWGGERFVSDSGNETYIEGGEYVVNKKSTQKYKALIDAINNDNLANLQAMLSGTGVMLNDDKIESYKALKQIFSNGEIKNKIEIENKLGNKEIKEFKKAFDVHIKNQSKKSEVKIENGYRVEIKGSRTIRTKLNG